MQVESYLYMYTTKETETEMSGGFLWRRRCKHEQRTAGHVHILDA